MSHVTEKIDKNGKKNLEFAYFRFVKTFILVILASFLTADLAAQVIFRNDFVINRKQGKIENKGLTFISINLDNYPNWNQLINGRGGRSLQIDVRAIRQPRRHYDYSEIAEKVYVPNVSTPAIHAIPLFLLMPPPQLKMPVSNISLN